MKIVKLIVSNYRGIRDSTEITFNDFTCIVGKNDVGKSTILKAIDAFLNDTAISIFDKNYESESNLISMDIVFDNADVEIELDDTIKTTFKNEELTDTNGCLRIRKIWDLRQAKVKPKWYIYRKEYQNDFLLLTERDLISLCKEKGVETHKANGEAYNNKEKRNKLRLLYAAQGVEFEYLHEELPTTGTTRAKRIYDALKKVLPTFEYFKADSSLSDSDSSVQKYFKDKALKYIDDQINTGDFENQIKVKIGGCLATITDKINSVLSAEEQIEAQVNFDWSKLISTSFKCKSQEKDIPLSFRGDGFRRITMMSYFEMLAEERNEDKNIVFGFEEPETFLHPEIQNLLFDRLKSMSENNYQVLITTHSPNLVTQCNSSNLIHVCKDGGDYVVKQGEEADIKAIVEDLGIKIESNLVKLFGDATKVLFLVEGPDDVKAMHHTAKIYKANGKIEKDFHDCGVVIIPVGGCSSIQHWSTYNVIKDLGKPYFILLDSDKTSSIENSPNLAKLYELGYHNDQCAVLKKREIECYIPESYFVGLTPPINDLHYGDYDDVKALCKTHAKSIQLGGKKVCDKHFANLSFEQLRSTFCPSGNDAEDEFLDIYNKVLAKIDQ